MSSKYFYLYLALLITLICGFFAYHQSALAGQGYWLKIAAGDPRDLLRGDFITLRYEISQCPDHLDYDHFSFGQTVYVELKENEGFWSIAQLHESPPETSAPYLTATYEYNGHLDYHIGRYYVPEGMGNPPQPLTVEIVIGRNHNAMIRKLHASGQPWPKPNS